MSATDATGEKSTGTIDASDLPPAVGVDADGHVHHVDSVFPNYVVLTDGDGAVVDVRDMLGRERDAWMQFVAEDLGWEDRWADERLSPSAVREHIAAALEATR